MNGILFSLYLLFGSFSGSGHYSAGILLLYAMDTVRI